LQSLGKIWNMIYHCWKFFLGPEECPVIFLLLRDLQTAEAYNGKWKICSGGKQWQPKKFTVTESLLMIFSYLPLSLWHLKNLYLHYCKFTT
jgi:hypothetical protein